MSRLRVCALTVLLAVTVVLAAGMAGTVHFSGPRWFPHIGSSHHAPPASKVRFRHGPTTQAHRPLPSSGGALGIVFWIIVAVVAALALWRLWLWWSSRSRSVVSSLSVAAQPATTTVVVAPPEPEPDAPVLMSGIELALQTLDEQRDPSDAIIRAWLGLQETAEESGIVRGASETPTEFTARILKRAFADDRAIGTLLRLYLRTRFGDHPATEADVAEVRAALSDLVRGWRSSEAIIRR